MFAANGGNEYFSRQIYFKFKVYRGCPYITSVVCIFIFSYHYNYAPFKYDFDEIRIQNKETEFRRFNLLFRNYTLLTFLLLSI